MGIVFNRSDSGGSRAEHTLVGTGSTPPVTHFGWLQIPFVGAEQACWSEQVIGPGRGVRHRTWHNSGGNIVEVSNISSWGAGGTAGASEVLTASTSTDMEPVMVSVASDGSATIYTQNNPTGVVVNTTNGTPSDFTSADTLLLACTYFDGAYQQRSNMHIEEYARWTGAVLGPSHFAALSAGAKPEDITLPSGALIYDVWPLRAVGTAGTPLTGTMVGVVNSRVFTLVGDVRISARSSPVVRTVADTTPPAMTGSITIGTVTSSSIQMSWSAGSDNVAVTSYEVSSNGGTSYTDVGNVLTYTFTGLTPSTSYNLRVRAKDAAGNVSTPLSATQSTSVAADTTPPSMTGIVSSSSVAATSATISWSAGTDNVAVTGYEYRLNGGTYTSVGNVLTTNLTGLTASTAYTVDVRAFDAAGNRSAIITGTFTTSAASDTVAPTMTGSITVGTVTSTSIQISWSAGSDNVAVTAYEVSSNGGTSYSNVGNVLTFTFTGLTASTSYSLRVRARDAAGNVSSALSVSQSTSAGSSVTLKRIVVVLTTNGTAPASSLSNLKWAFFDENRPDLFGAPSCQGATEITDLSGVLEIDVTDSTLAIGQTGWLIITDSDGTVFQNPPAKAFSAPVQVIAV
jgi:chitodextrinase